MKYCSKPRVRAIRATASSRVYCKTHLTVVVDYRSACWDERRSVSTTVLDLNPQVEQLTKQVFRFLMARKKRKEEVVSRAADFMSSDNVRPLLHVDGMIGTSATLDCQMANVIPLWRVIVKTLKSLSYELKKGYFSWTNPDRPRFTSTLDSSATAPTTGTTAAAVERTIVQQEAESKRVTCWYKICMVSWWMSGTIVFDDDKLPSDLRDMRPLETVRYNIHYLGRMVSSREHSCVENMNASRRDWDHDCILSKSGVKCCIIVMYLPFECRQRTTN